MGKGYTLWVPAAGRGVWSDFRRDRPHSYALFKKRKYITLIEASLPTNWHKA